MRVQSFGVAAAVLLGFGMSSQAEEIPQRYLDMDHASCMSACTSKGGPENFCKPHCDCSIEKTRQTVTLEEYLEVVRAMSEGKDAPKPVMDRLTEIALDCAIETKKKMSGGN